MTILGVNYVAVLIAALASFGFGVVWYMGLAAPWMAAIGKNKADLEANASRTPFIVAIVALVIMAIVLHGLLSHLGMLNLRDASISAFLIWLGFIATTLYVNHRFQGSPWQLTAIDGGYWLGVLLIQGLILGLFGS